jgi:sugar/nucleoside kinase (ribokinase family)
MSLLSLGSVAFDAIETPFGKTEKIVGGAATYISIAASYFTQPINLVSVVGNDFPQETIEDFKQRGIDIEGLEMRQNEKSFFWSGRYHNDLNTRDTLVTELNVMETFNPTLPESYKDTDFVMLGNMAPDIQVSVMEQLNSKPKLAVMDTMNLWLDTALDSVKKALKLVDVLVVNDEEARQLANEYSLVKAGKLIRDMGPKYLVIKKGEHGALLFYDNNIFHAPALPLEEVFDPTGAGDTFAGGFLGYLASSGEIGFENMKNAVVYGSAMASFCVEKFGPERLQNLEIDEIRKRARQFMELVNFDLSKATLQA